MLTGNLAEVGATILLAVIYLIIVRILDVNEREPLWSVVLVFLLGGIAAGVLYLLVSPLTLELDLVAGAVWREVAVFLALAAGVWVLSEISRVRGWSELTDLVDGIVYGMAAGLGFAAGDALVRGIVPMAELMTESSVWSVLPKTALAGLAQGVFGGIIGVGFGLAASWRVRSRWIWPLVALSVAIVAQIGHQWLAYGDALGGSSAVIRGWVALIIPVVILAAVAVYGLAAERRVIARELTGEVAAGYVTEQEIVTLRTFGPRQLALMHALLTGRFRRRRAFDALQNRQVMLALAKQRAGRQSSERAQAHTRAEIEALRRSISALRSQLERDGAGGSRP